MVWDGFRRSVDALLPDCRRHGVRIALENMARDNFDALESMMASYGPDVMGVCYDSGHGCIAGNGLDRLAPLAHRLIAVHLHDNDGLKDLHQPLFMGKANWLRLAQIIAASGYDRPAMTVEAVIRNSGTQDEHAFLLQTLDGTRRFDQMLAAAANELT
jgi:sugar phosphate isomerase/epimerase